MLKLLIILLFLTSVCKADDNPENLLIYVDKTPPKGYNFSEWNEAVLKACQVWYFPACSIILVENKNEAEIVFTTKDLVDRYGECSKYGEEYFPRIPSTANRTVIRIDKDIESIEHSDLLRTLKHEVGHSAGIDHHPSSIVYSGVYDRVKLTDYDKIMVRRLHRHIRNMSNDK